MRAAFLMDQSKTSRAFRSSITPGSTPGSLATSSQVRSGPTFLFPIDNRRRFLLTDLQNLDDESGWRGVHIYGREQELLQVFYNSEVF